MKTKNGIIIISCILLLGALSFYSCNNPISLGERLNIDPPTVTIEKPDFMENIKGTLEIEGTAADEQEVMFLYITVERVSADGPEWKQEWQAERGTWRSQNDARNADGTWSAQKSRNKVNVNWSIKMSMEDAPNGEYLITARAINNVKNEGTLQQRRVVIDTTPPVVTILAPLLEFDDSDANTPTYSYAGVVKPAFDEYELQAPAVLDRLHNQSIRIQYEIKDDFSIDTLVFQLADHEGNTYYEKPVAELSWSGRTDILAQDIIDPADGHIIDYGEKLYLQVISRAADKAGNEKVQSHGWLVYWPNADKPWVEGVGTKNEAAPREFTVFPGSDVQGQAYDDDGVQSVSYRIYIKSSDVLVAEDTLINEPLVEGESPSAFFSWKFIAPVYNDEYKIVLDCTDVNGTSGDQIIRYFYVLDSSAPSVTLASPDQNVSLFGDSGGNFTVSGFADDAEEPVKLMMVWIHPDDKDNRFAYQSSEYSGWNNLSITNGSKIWELTLVNPQFNPITRRYTKDFTKTINLFSDLNIGTAPGQALLTTQTFILRVEGKSGQAVAKTVSFRGDVTPPVLAIDTITLNNGSSETFTIADLIANSKALPAMKAGDQITLKGTWSDDSYATWGQTGKMGTFEVLWNGDPVPAASLAAGSWSAGPLTLTTAQAQTGAVYISASLKDAGNNVAEKSASVKVDTNVPFLMHITSDKPDGYYKAGEIIEISLEFNKEVSFTGGGTPTLTLNTNNGTSGVVVNCVDHTTLDTKHKFTYTVAAGQNTGADRLNVTAFGTAGGSWTGSGGTAVMNNYQNLKDTKNIIIDTTAPTISKVESLSGATSGTTYFGPGKTLYLQVTFNEDIILPVSNSITLTLNAGSGTQPSLSGTKSLLFTYTVGIVGSGQNANPLTASALTGANVITDLAGNNLAAFTVPSAQNINNNTGNSKTIVIDTIAPAVPTFSPANIAGTFTSSQSFTLSGETGATLQYSVVGTSGPWLPYPTGGVTLSSAGTYNISARQTDLAGNVSSAAGVQQVIIKVNSPLLVSFGGTPGTYKTGGNIDIKVNLRGNVTVAGTPILVIGGTNPGTGAGQDKFTGNALTANANYNSGSGTNTLVFRYTVRNGDSVNVLKINSITMTGVTLTEGGNNVTTELVTSGWANNLDFYTTIKIDTTIPVFTSASISGTTLTLNFDKPVYKGTGSITLELPTASRRAPAVLTKTEYLRYGGASVLGSYYTVGTNGTDASGNPDLTEKYILDFDRNTTDTDNTAAGTGAVITALGNNNFFKVTVPVVSGAVTASGNSLTVNLSDTYGYVLPVKGVSYTVNFPAGLVQDSLGNSVVALTGTGTTVANSGVNKPVIRIQKNRETLLNDAGVFVGRFGVGEPVTNWVKNAKISTTTPPSDGHNWAETGSFSIDLGGQKRFSTNGYDITGIKQNRATFPTTEQDYAIQVTLIDSGANQNSNGQSLYYNNTWTDFAYGWGDDGIGGAATTKTFWINPYKYKITLGINSYDNIYLKMINGVWVDLNTSGASILTQAQYDALGDKTGYLRVSKYDNYEDRYKYVLTATQPLTAAVKIDCQTPGAAITYTSTPATATTSTGPFNGTTNPAKPAVTMPNASGTGYTTQFTIGNAANTSDGYLYGIRAAASLSGNTSDPSYEKAARSVIRFDNVTAANNWSTNANLVNKADNLGRELHLWIRGGDGLSGSSLTPGFPLSWSDKDYTGARLMTRPAAANGVWYWVTWEVSSQAYFHFIAGTTSSAAAAANGPHNWAWGKNAWAFQYAMFPLYAGGSLTFSTATQATGQATSTFEFYDNFSGSR